MIYKDKQLYVHFKYIISCTRKTTPYSKLLQVPIQTVAGLKKMADLKHKSAIPAVWRGRS